MYQIQMILNTEKPWQPIQRMKREKYQGISVGVLTAGKKQIFSVKITDYLYAVWNVKRNITKI